jgi:hypothetical protein
MSTTLEAFSRKRCASLGISEHTLLLRKEERLANHYRTPSSLDCIHFSAQAPNTVQVLSEDGLADTVQDPSPVVPALTELY